MAELPEVGISTYGDPIVIPCGRDMSGYDTRRVYYCKPDGVAGNIDHSDVTTVDDPNGNANYALRFLSPENLFNTLGEYLFFPWGQDSGGDHEGRPGARIICTARK